MTNNDRVCEYFVITGLTNQRKSYDLSQINSHTEEIRKSNFEFGDDVFKFKEPIVDIQLVNIKEKIPDGYIVIDKSYNKQFKADLYGKSSVDELYLCYRYGRDIAPITDIWLFNPKEKLNHDPNWKYIEKTISGQYSANLHSSTSNPLYLAYKRAGHDASVNCMAVTDICIIFINKNDHCPPAYLHIGIPIKRSTLSHTINICYKKSMVKQHVLTYHPETLYAVSCTSTEPIVDVCNPQIDLCKTSSNLPPEILDVANFCMPWGATIESWLTSRHKPIPSFLSFVLTDEKYNRMYGAAIHFYDELNPTELTQSELNALQLPLSRPKDSGLYISKALCLLSRNSLLTTFKRVLEFLVQHNHQLNQFLTSSNKDLPPQPLIPVERFISQLLHTLAMPSPQTPNLHLQWDLDNPIVINLPQSNYSANNHNLYHFIRLLNIDQIIQLFVYMLTEQKLLITSTSNTHLTNIAEALIATIFPFRWSVVYIPFLYLSCIHIIQSPAPYLIGVDSRFFDYFNLPEGVGCLDLITKTLTPPETHSNLQLDFNKVLPKSVLKNLKAGLLHWKSKVERFEKEQSLRRTTGWTIDDIYVLRKRESYGESIRECFLRANIALFKNYQQYLIPLDQRCNQDEMFRVDGFLKGVDKNSRPLYMSIFDTQLWNNFILQRSQSIEFDDSLIFFDSCIRRLKDLDETTAANTPLFTTESAIKSEYTRVVERPDPIEIADLSEMVKLRKGFPDSLNSQYMLQPIFTNYDEQIDTSINNSINPSINISPSQGVNPATSYNSATTTPNKPSEELKKLTPISQGSYSTLDVTSNLAGSDVNLKGSSASFAQTLLESSLPVLLLRSEDLYNFPMRKTRRGTYSSVLRRPMEEYKQSREIGRDAKMSIRGCWATHLLSSCYCLWYVCLPGLLGHVLDTPGLNDTGLLNRIVQLAVETLINIPQPLPDEVACRVLMVLIRQLRPPYMHVSDLMQAVPLNAISYALCNQIMVEENSEQKWRDRQNTTGTQQDKEDGTMDQGISMTTVSTTEVAATKTESDKDSGLDTLITPEKPQDNNQSDKVFGDDNMQQQQQQSQQKQQSQQQQQSQQRCTVEIGGRQIKLRSKSNLTSTTKLAHTQGNKRFSQVITSQTSVPGSGGGVITSGNTIGQFLVDPHQDKHVQYYNKSAGIIMSCHLPKASPNDSSIGGTNSSGVSHARTPHRIMPRIHESDYDQSIVTVGTDTAASPPAKTRHQSMISRPLTSAIINSPFSEEKSQIHQSFLLGKSQASTNSNCEQPKDMLNEVCETLRDQITAKQKNTNHTTPSANPGTGIFTRTFGSLISADSSEYGSTEDRSNMTQSEFGDSGPNKARTSFRQMKNVANKSFKSFKNVMLNIGGGINANSLQNASGDGPNMGPGMPGTFRPWGAKTRSSNDTMSRAGRTASVDVLDNLGETRESTINRIDRSTMGSATVQQVRKNNPNNSSGSGGSHYMNTLANAAQYLTDFNRSTDSLNSNKSEFSGLDNASEPVLNLNHIWERITGSLAAIKLPTGKFWPSHAPVEQDDKEPRTPLSPMVECKSSIYVNMTSCTECPHCKQPIYDDNIMESWSWDDNDHRALCQSCQQPTTSKLYLQVYIRVAEPAPTNDNDGKSPGKLQYRSVLATHRNESYLSPFVIRKELDSIIEQEGEVCLLRPDFYTRHRYLYWNLIWYFTRLQLPTHLLQYLTFWLRDQGLSMQQQDKQQTAESKKAYQLLVDLTGHEQVTILTFWDFTHSPNRSNDSLFRNYFLFKQLSQNCSANTVLNPSLVQSGKYAEHIYQSVANNDLYNAIVAVVQYRINKLREFDQYKSNSNYQTLITNFNARQQSIYRELFFLLLLWIDSLPVDFDVFHELFHKMSQPVYNIYQPYILPQDRPISTSAMECMKVFKPLFLS